LVTQTSCLINKSFCFVAVGWWCPLLCSLCFKSWRSK